MVSMGNVILDVSARSSIIHQEHNSFTFVVPNDVLQFVWVLFVGNKKACVDGNDLLKSCFTGNAKDCGIPHPKLSFN